MKALAYLVFAITAFLVIAGMHALSYSRDIPRGAFQVMSVTTFALCLPLVVLFVRVKKGVPQQEAWHRFWESAVKHCPRWVWSSMTIAWFLGILSVVRTFLGHDFTAASFHTAWLLMPAGAALSYAVTLVRTPARRHA
jgi:hypothetical protein